MILEKELINYFLLQKNKRLLCIKYFININKPVRFLRRHLYPIFSKKYNLESSFYVLKKGI